MSRYKPYPKYKENGIEWLGEVPEGWEVKKLKHFINMIQTGTTPTTANLEYYDDGNINWFNPVDLNDETVNSSNKKVTKKAIIEGACRLFPSDSVLIVGIGATAGKTSYLSSEPSSFNQQITGFYSHANSNKYLFYLMKSFTNTLLATANFTTLPILNNDFFKAFTVVMPSKHEQKQIANFLDRETTKIDTLIGKQERLIELLQEKRQALISHAVTKGLDPNVKMKESGVAWLGEVPEHWEIHQLQHSVDGCVNGIWGNEPNDKDDLIVIRVADFNRQNFSVNTNKLTKRAINNQERKNRLLKKGDLLLEKSGGGDNQLVGTVVRFDEEFDAVTSNFVAKMTPLSEFDSQFLTYAFSHLYAGRVNYMSIKQNTGIQNLDSSQYLREYFSFPSKEQQQQIADYLDIQTSKIDSLVEKAKQAIKLLKERRTALISAAVTGKIQVNDEVKEDTQGAM